MNGKATIELLVPHVLLYIRNADPDELAAFLRNVTEIVLDEEFGAPPHHRRVWRAPSSS